MEPVAHGLTYADLLEMPEDARHRHELIDGDHFVSPSPRVEHQRVVTRCLVLLDAWAREHGGQALPAPTDVRFSDRTVLVPDVFLLSADTLARATDEQAVDVRPDVVVEVSSPRTRSYDQLRKRRVYEEFGVPSYWFVDLGTRTVLVHDVGPDGTYGTPTTFGAGDTIAPQHLPGLVARVDELFG